MRIVVFSATELGFRCVETLFELGEEIVGIFTIPKEFKISYSPDALVVNVRHFDFNQIGKRYGVPVVEISGRMSDPAYEEILKKWSPDIIIAAGWYYMVPRSIRRIPRLGAMGFHASLLPRYSGGAPLTWAIINGEEKTGVTFFYLDEGVDNGDVISQKTIPITFEDTIKTLIEKTQNSVCDILKETIPLIKIGKNRRMSQDEKQRTIFPQRKPQDGLINWNNSSLGIYNFIRAQTRPYPGAFTDLNGERLTIWGSRILDRPPRKGSPGEILTIVNAGPVKGVAVATADSDSALLLTEMQIGGDPVTLDRFTAQQKEIIERKLGNG